MLITELKTIVKTSPAGPGIYAFKDSDEKTLYIGKASSLRSRLNSYLKTEDSRTQKMIAKAEQVSFIETQSDIEALILESQFIKTLQPQFNIMLRDDKQYFFVAFTDDQHPRIFLTHQPYSANRLTLSPRPRKPVPTVSPLRGTPSATGFKSKSVRFAAEYIGPFTDGAALKATLRVLRNIFPYCTCTQLHHNFCLNYHINKCLGYCCLRNSNNPEALTQYRENIKSIKAILNGKKNQLIKNIEKEMKAKAASDDFDGAITLRKKLEHIQRVFENAQILKNSKVLEQHKPFLQSLFKTHKSITRIEGYDISNIQGIHATGAMVTFVNGLADKNYYRKFKIKTQKTANDTAMLHEVLMRRFNHHEWPFPDLIIIDGGKGQVNTATNLLKDMEINIPVIGLTKDKRHIGVALTLPKKKNAISLTTLSEQEKNLILQIDGEAHRFAISFYRHLHKKTLSG